MIHAGHTESEQETARDGGEAFQKNCAEALPKSRINPGNVGKGDKRARQFGQMIEAAMRWNKPVRIRFQLHEASLYAFQFTEEAEA